MASWLPETLFEIVAQGPAPSKDYYQLLVTRSQVIFRWWKVSLRSEYRSSKPGEAKESHENFLQNSHLQVQIALIFGGRILDYVFNLCEGKFDFLERLSDNLLLNIISYLDLEDLTNLSQTSRRFSKYFYSSMKSESKEYWLLSPQKLMQRSREIEITPSMCFPLPMKQLCRSDKLWELIVRSACDNITPDMRALAEEMGWRQMFFTNKLQLQQQIRERRQSQESQGSNRF